MSASGETRAAPEDVAPRHHDDYRRLLEQRRMRTAAEPTHRVAFGGPGRTHEIVPRPRHAAADRAHQRARITTRRHG